MSDKPMNHTLIKRGFLLAGLINLAGILLVTQGLSSPTIMLADPAVFSGFGVVMIMLWGLAYIGTAAVAQHAVLLPLTFALEKAAYTLNWVFWLDSHSAQLPAILEQDWLGGAFLAAYGINDGLFGLFFAAVAIRNWRAARLD